MSQASQASPAPYDPSGHEHLHAAFGQDRFGQAAERLARFFGTPQYILGQTIVVIIWIAINAAAISLNWDPYPFILLNLAFSTQAAYAAPLILLAQTRAAERTKVLEDASAEHRDQLAGAQQLLLEQNTRLTEEAARLTKQIDELTLAIHRRVVGESGSAR
jgi:uncharacterized membrane protein